MSEALRTKYRVGGMDCAACATKIETAVSRLPGVSEVSASFTSGTLNVVHDNVPFAAVQRTVKSLCYSLATDGANPEVGAAPSHDHDHDHDHGAGGHFELGEGPWWKTRKAMSR